MGLQKPRHEEERVDREEGAKDDHHRVVINDVFYIDDVGPPGSREDGCVAQYHPSGTMGNRERGREGGRGKG